MSEIGPIGVVVVNYNTWAHLRACLASVVRAGAHEVVVVDNASEDGSVAMVRNLFPEVKLIVSRVNRGYGAGANEGIRHCGSPYVLLLNSDTLLREDSLRTLACYLETHPRVAAAAPQLINSDGTPQPSAFPPPSALPMMIRESSLQQLVRSLPTLRRYYLEPKAGPVPWVLGAALTLRRDVFLGLNGFDESYFMYFEEVDLCYRLRDAGWEVHFAPVTEIVHVGGASTRPLAVGMAVQLYRSHLQFACRHFSLVRRQLLQLALFYVLTRNYVRDSLHLWEATNSTEQRRLREAVESWSRALAVIGSSKEGA